MFGATNPQGQSARERLNVNETTRNAPQEAFRRGYLDAWSIRGNGLAPSVPAYFVEPGEDPYRAGVSLAVRDAATKALDEHGNERDVSRVLSHIWVGLSGTLHWLRR
jgi:hypothetical protein